MLLTTEQTNKLLLKNNDLRPAGTKAILESNAVSNKIPAILEAVSKDRGVVPT